MEPEARIHESIIPSWMSTFARKTFEKNDITHYKNRRVGLEEPQIVPAKGSEGYEFYADGFSGSFGHHYSERPGVDSSRHNYVEVEFTNEASGVTNSLLFENMVDARTFVMANFNGKSLEMKRLDSLCDTLGYDLVQTTEFRGLGKDILDARTGDGIFNPDNVRAQASFVVDAVPCVMSDAFEKRFHGIRSYRESLEGLLAPLEKNLFCTPDTAFDFSSCFLITRDDEGLCVPIGEELPALREADPKDLVVTNNYLSARTLAQASCQPVVLAGKGEQALSELKAFRAAVPDAKLHFIAGVRKTPERDAFESMSKEFGCRLRTPNFTLSEKGMGKDTVFDLKCARGMEGVLKQFHDLSKEQGKSQKKGIER